MAAVCDLDEAQAFREPLPPAAHARAAERCLEAGAHLFVEKPFAISAAECRRVEAAAAASTALSGELRLTNGTRFFQTWGGRTIGVE